MSDKTILLVEDNSDDAELTLRALSRAQVENEVIVKRDGAEALEYLLGRRAGGEPGELPAVVLLDLKLPRIGGLEVLERLRSEPHTRLLPIVILTSSDEDCDVARGYALGANSYVRKPVDFDQFADAVRQVGLYWTAINEAPRKS